MFRTDFWMQNWNSSHKTLSRCLILYVFDFVYVSNPGYLNWDSQLHEIKWLLKYFTGSGIG